MLERLGQGVGQYLRLGAPEDLRARFVTLRREPACSR